MLATTAQKFGSNGKSFKAPSAVAPVIGAALLASGTSETADTAWSPAAACLLPDILPVAGTLLSYGGSRQLAAGGTVTHSGALTLGGALTLPGNPSSALHAAPKQYVDSAVGAIDLSGRVPYTGATGSVNLGSNALTCGAITASGQIYSTAGTAMTVPAYRVADSGYQTGVGSTGALVTGALISNSIGVMSWNFSLGLILKSTLPLSWSDADINGAADVFLYRGGAGILQQRNGLNAQCYRLNKTYTSDASQEALMLDAGKQISGKLGLYSYRGSSGGSNYPVQIGMLAADGSTFSGLTIGTDGNVSIGANGWKLKDNGASSFVIETSGGTSIAMFPGSTGGEVVFRGGYLRLTGTTGPYLDMTSATAIGLRTNAGGYLSLTAGQITQVPPSSLTLATNGQFSIEMTSNTAGNPVYRGSDGTTRRSAIVFV